MNTLLKSFVYAASGIRHAVAKQRNMKIHLIITIVVVAGGLYYNVSTLEWSVLALAVGLVMTAELVNSSIESLVDILEPSQHPIAGRVKDMAAGAVLIASVCAAVAGVLVFVKYFTV